MAAPQIQQCQHLLWRAGFGPTPGQLKNSSKPKSLLKQLKATSAQATPLEVPMQQYDRDDYKKGISAEDRAEYMRRRRQELLQVNTQWLNKMATSEEQLREKLTFFWHGHFACRTQRPDFALNQINTLRQHALGKFGDILLAVAKDSAMLQFLNNQQNRKSQPNENFAREVLELFTMGRGHYTEHDIKNAARAFTGWGFKPDGAFQFRDRQHDFGEKAFLGKTGRFNGEEILQIILEQRQTAAFMTRKLYAFLVNEKVDEAVVVPLAKAFYESEYDILVLLEQMFASADFYAPSNIGAKIKSPVELLVGLMRTINMRFEDPRGQLLVQRALGQVLLQPPNVSGWAGGRAWIDSSSLSYRLALPKWLIGGTSPDITLKGDDDLDPNQKRQARRLNQQLKTTIDTTELESLTKGLAVKSMVEVLCDYLLMVQPRPQSKELLQKITTSAAPEKRVVALTTAILSLPEYQLA